MGNFGISVTFWFSFPLPDSDGYSDSFPRGPRNLLTGIRMDGPFQSQVVAALFIAITNNALLHQHASHVIKSPLNSHFLCVQIFWSIHFTNNSEIKKLHKIRMMT